MKDKVFSDFSCLSIEDKKRVLLSELAENVKFTEKMCSKVSTSCAKLPTRSNLQEKKVLTDDECLTLIYEYCFLLRENNSALLVKLMK